MVKPELGTKRVCPNCGTKYYDLDREPIVCPRCGTNFETGVVRARPQAVAPVEEEEDEVEVAPEADAEFVSLEEADEEVADGGVVKVEGEEDEVEEAEEDDTFLQEDDEEDENVEDIIGDVDEEER